MFAYLTILIVWLQNPETEYSSGMKLIAMCYVEKTMIGVGIQFSLCSM